MTTTIFIDGGQGTTGLEIRERLAGRSEISLISLDDSERKDPDARRDALRKAEIAILCLPDDAAREAVAFAGDSDVRFIDASTAHRTCPDWVFGFPEIEASRADEIGSARRVANHGCYAATFLAMVRPLVRAGLMPENAKLTVNATSGYSGGGRAMIDAFESGDAATAFRNYALTLQHKHVPEMQHHAGLENPPLFSPSVANSYRGMIVEIPLHLATLNPGTTAETVRSALEQAYDSSPVINILSQDECAALDLVTLERCANTDRMEIMLFANPVNGHIRLCAALDNLGKGAAGNAVQCLNLMAGLDQFAGLRL